MGLTLVEKQRMSYIAEQKRIFERNLLKQLKLEHKAHTSKVSSVRESSSRRS